MSQYAKHKCHECEIIRPANYMLQKEIAYKSGRSGVSFSFNPLANMGRAKNRNRVARSLRIHSGRSYKRMRKVWVCNTSEAHNVPNYFKELEDIKLKLAKERKEHEEWLDKTSSLRTRRDEYLKGLNLVSGFLTKKSSYYDFAKELHKKYFYSAERVKILSTLKKKEYQKKIKKFSLLKKYIKANDDKNIVKKFGHDDNESLRLVWWSDSIKMFNNYVTAYDHFFEGDLSSFKKILKKDGLISFFTKPEKKLVEFFDKEKDIRDLFRTLNSINFSSKAQHTNSAISFFAVNIIAESVTTNNLEHVDEKFIDEVVKDNMTSYTNVYDKNFLEDLIAKSPHVGKNKNLIKKIISLLISKYKIEYKETNKSKTIKDKHLETIFNKENCFDLINALLCLIVANLDGKLNKEENNYILNRFKLSKKDENLILNLSKNITKNKTKIENVLKETINKYDNKDLLQGIVDNLIYVAELDNRLDDKEKKFIVKVANVFDLKKNKLNFKV